MTNHYRALLVFFPEFPARLRALALGAFAPKPNHVSNSPESSSHTLGPAWPSKTAAAAANTASLAALPTSSSSVSPPLPPPTPTGVTAGETDRESLGEAHSLKVTVGLQRSAPVSAASALRTKGGLRRVEAPGREARASSPGGPKTAPGEVAI